MTSTYTDSLPTRKTSQLFGLLGWLLLCFSASATAVFVSIDGWYAALRKPAWNPPSWVFGPVWFSLYTMMAVAAWLVWREGGWKSRRGPLTFFIVQWALNLIWTPLFFGLHRPGAALVEIVLLWMAIVATLFSFYKVKPSAGLLLIPYFLWVSFAAFLNFTIWNLNR